MNDWLEKLFAVVVALVVIRMVFLGLIELARNWAERQRASGAQPVPRPFLFVIIAMAGALLMGPLIYAFGFRIFWLGGYLFGGMVGVGMLLGAGICVVTAVKAADLRQSSSARTVAVVLSMLVALLAIGMLASSCGRIAIYQ